MKRTFCYAAIAVVIIILAACGGNDDTDIQDLPEAQNVADDGIPETQNVDTVDGDGAVDFSVAKDVIDIHTVNRSLAGFWDWPEGGNSVIIYDDGTWRHGLGDATVFGYVSIAEYNGKFSLEFIITHAEGPGAYGWIPPGETQPAAGTEYGVRPGIWRSGVYYSLENERHLENSDGTIFLIRRR